MGLRQTIANVVAIADRVTADLQCAFTLEPFVSKNADGDKTYGALQPHTGAIEWRQRLVQTALGKEVLAVATITVPRDIVIGVDDRLIITAGTVAPITGPITAPILAIRGVLDRVTKRPYATDIYLGAEGGATQKA